VLWDSGGANRLVSFVYFGLGWVYIYIASGMHFLRVYII
jgi:hypothetical protein